MVDFRTEVILDIAQLKQLLKLACASVENQNNWDKKPYSLWYYDAKKLLRKLGVSGND